MSNELEPGSFVTLRVCNPKENLWGKLLNITQAGITIRGIDIQYIEAYKYQFGGQEQEVFPQTMFFPMQRVEKVFLDESVGDIPSVIDTIVQMTGKDPDELLK